MFSKIELEWVALREIGNSWLIRMTALTPFVGYVILFNVGLVGYFEIFIDRIIETTRDSTLAPTVVENHAAISRLFYIYFGLCCLGIGSIIYQVFCPQLVKEYSSSRQYVRKEYKYFTSNRAEELINSLLEKPYKYKSKLERTQRSLNNPGKDAQMSGVVDLLDIHWRIENGSRSRTKFFSSVFFLLGFVLLSVPSLHVFLKVCAVFTKL